MVGVQQYYYQHCASGISLQLIGRVLDFKSRNLLKPFKFLFIRSSEIWPGKYIYMYIIMSIREVIFRQFFHSLPLNDVRSAHLSCTVQFYNIISVINTVKYPQYCQAREDLLQYNEIKDLIFTSLHLQRCNLKIKI